MHLACLLASVDPLLYERRPSAVGCSVFACIAFEKQNRILTLLAEPQDLVGALCRLYLVALTDGPCREVNDLRESQEIAGTVAACALLVCGRPRVSIERIVILDPAFTVVIKPSIFLILSLIHI